MPQLRPRQTWEELCAELEAEKDRECKAMESWRVQMREQRKPGVFPNWKVPLIASLVALAAFIWVIKQIIDAVGR